MSNYIVYVLLLGVIILGSVIGEYYRMMKPDNGMTPKQFLANFIMSVFASFMIVLYFYEGLNGLLERIGFSGFISIQDYQVVNKIINKIANLKLSFKEEGDDEC